MSKKVYKTEGRQRLMGFFEAHPDCQFTVEELCVSLNGDAQSGRSSLYRQLGELCREDVLRVFRSEDKKCSVYQYVGSGCDCREHFHAKCVKCGKIEHLHCGDSSEFARHLMDGHGFRIDCGQSVLYGVCARCNEGGEGVLE